MLAYSQCTRRGKGCAARSGRRALTGGAVALKGETSFETKIRRPTVRQRTARWGSKGGDPPTGEDPGNGNQRTPNRVGHRDMESLRGSLQMAVSVDRIGFFLEVKLSIHFETVGVFLKPHRSLGSGNTTVNRDQRQRERGGPEEGRICGVLGAAGVSPPSYTRRGCGGPVCGHRTECQWIGDQGLGVCRGSRCSRCFISGCCGHM